MVGLADPPGPTGRVGDDHPEKPAGPLSQRPAEGGGAGVRVLGQQQDQFRSDVGPVHPGGGEGPSVPVPDDHGLAAPGHGADGRRPDRRLPITRRRRSALGLADDLGRDDHDVPVGQRARRVALDGVDQHVDQIGGRGDLAQAGRREDGDHPGQDITA
jgi:hypothetical protein